MADNDLHENYSRIWDEIAGSRTSNLEELYDFPVSDRAHERLSQLIGEPFPSRKPGESLMVLNRRIRSVVHKKLRDSETTEMQAGELYAWIVADWGGIHAGLENVMTWASRAGWHGAYNNEELLAFADDQRRRRVASWSKVFAFSAPDDHAIYDSRVAVSLNIALHRLNLVPAFFMPPSRNKSVARARQRLSGRFPKIIGQKYYYRDYLAWAKKVRAEKSITLLDIEATLFALAPQLASDFLSGSST